MPFLLFRPSTQTSHMPRSRVVSIVESHVIFSKAALNRGTHQPAVTARLSLRHRMDMLMLAMLGPQKQFVP
jgi:hypothetical protein